MRTSKLFSLRAKRKFYNCSPFLGQNGRKTATTTAPPAKLAPTHAPASPPRALVAAWGRCAPILATPLLPQCHKQGPKRGVFTLGSMSRGNSGQSSVTTTADPAEMEAPPAASVAAATAADDYVRGRGGHVRSILVRVVLGRRQVLFRTRYQHGEAAEAVWARPARGSGARILRPRS